MNWGSQTAIPSIDSGSPMQECRIRSQATDICITTYLHASQTRQVNMHSLFEEMRSYSPDVALG